MRRDPPADAFVESYVGWREECLAVARTYEWWAGSERGRRALAYAAYRAALDREEKAADVYRLASTRLLAAARKRRAC